MTLIVSFLMLFFELIDYIHRLRGHAEPVSQVIQMLFGSLNKSGLEHTQTDPAYEFGVGIETHHFQSKTRKSGSTYNKTQAS